MEGNVAQVSLVHSLPNLYENFQSFPFWFSFLKFCDSSMTGLRRSFFSFSSRTLQIEKEPFVNWVLRNIRMEILLRFVSTRIPVESLRPTVLHPK
jgi:hypothetical protein